VASQHSDSSRTWRDADPRWVAIGGSVALHLLLYLLLGLGSLPTTELPIRLPLELEIGLGESNENELGGAAKVDGSHSEAPPTPARVRAPKRTVATPAAVDEQAVTSAEVAVSDAGVASSDAGAAQIAGSGTADGGPVGARRGIGGGDGSGFGTNGALLALRIDVANVRASALILETEALLSLVPGWQRMFAGSGLVPLSHFKRFVIATPNLHPSRLSMAATVRDGLRGVEALRERAGQAAPLRSEQGVSVGRWSARGTVVREIAFVNDQTFAISRAQDVMRLLALGRVLGSQIEDADRDPDPLLAGLMHMGKTEALSLSVHNVAAFVPEPNARLPSDLRFLLDEPTQHAVQLHVIGDYESEDAAEAALSHWRTTYDEIAARPDVATFGLAGAVEHANFERTQHQVHVRTQLTMAQLRYVLRQLSDLLLALVPRSAE